MTTISLRLYSILCLMLTCLGSFARVNEDMSDAVQKGTGEIASMDEYVDYPSLHIGVMDVLMVVVVLVSCYVFGKIWKGCTYLIILVSALFYYLMH